MRCSELAQKYHTCMKHGTPGPGAISDRVQFERF